MFITRTMMTKIKIVKMYMFYYVKLKINEMVKISIFYIGIVFSFSSVA